MENFDEDDRRKNKYTKNVTVVNDSVFMVGRKEGFYIPEENSIHLVKGDISYEDFGMKDYPVSLPVEFITIHERQHQINNQKGCYKSDMNMNEYYQRQIHDEIAARIAEKIELRRQYKMCKTETERKEFLKEYYKYAEFKDYVTAIAKGQINPNSTSSKDFLKEMAFIKNSSIDYIADSNNSGYIENWANNAIVYLSKQDGEIKSDPGALREDVKKMYNIGGFDFNKVGRQDIYMFENLSSISVADGLLQQGANAKKVAKLIKQGVGNSFKLAESFDVRGLNREQAEKVLQTVLITQEISKNVSGDLALGYANCDYDHGYFARNICKRAATYLDIKRDVWQKQGVLSDQGDEVKFNELMKKAKEIKLNPQAWFNDVKDILDIATDPTKADQLALVKKRIEELQGKVVNIDDVIAHPERYKLPLDETTVEEVLAKMQAEEMEHRAWQEEYMRNHPDKYKERRSDPYEIEIMDLESSVLQDEFKETKDEEKPQEKSGSRSSDFATIYTQDSIAGTIEVPRYNNAEIIIDIDDATGITTQFCTLDGKKHGAEVSYDKDGNIIKFNMYNHGQEIDLLNNKVDIIMEQQNDGTRLFCTKINNSPLGYAMTTDANGTSKATFYDDYGNVIMAAENSEIKITENHTSDQLGLTKQLEEAFMERHAGLQHGSQTSNDQFLQLWQNKNKENTVTYPSQGINSKRTRD